MANLSFISLYFDNGIAMNKPNQEVLLTEKTLDAFFDQLGPMGPSEKIALETFIEMLYDTINSKKANRNENIPIHGS